MFLSACIIFYGGRFIKLYIENNKVEASYFEYKKYYLWIKDSDNRISSRIVVDKQ